ncbi:hypothetical protein LTR86_000042 [Recurvomyces mirabilis]|nr:hypothetical protein LTR86_000042 [Recurvomyces mirabilis]
MAPHKGKDTLLDNCITVIQLGNNVAVHILEYMSDVEKPRHGFRELSTDFVESSRYLFSAKNGLTETVRSHTQFPQHTDRELREIFRQYHTIILALKQMVNKLLENERSSGFGKLGKGFRMMFADSDIEKMRLALVQCREAAKRNTMLYTWGLLDDPSSTSPAIGFTALAAVLHCRDPTCPVIPGSVQKHEMVPDAVPDRPFLPPEPTLRTVIHNQPAASHTNLPYRDASLPHHGDRERTTRPSATTTSSKTTVLSSTFSARGGARSSDTSGEPTTPSTEHFEEKIASLDLDDLPRQAIRVKVDPTTVTRWRPKHSKGSVPVGSKTALLVAVQDQNVKMVEHLLDSGVPPDYGIDCNLLRLAVLNHDIDSIRLLLAFGAESNAKDKDNYTPLYTATEASAFDEAQLLLKYGADPNISAGMDDQSPFALAMIEDKAHFAHLYLKHGATADSIMGNGNTPFIQAMNSTTPLQVIGLMLLYDTDPNHKNDHGETALFKAISAGRLDIVNILLDHDANPNLPGPKHMLWPSVHHPAILDLILKRGADLKRAPGVLELATSTNSQEVVGILLKHGADPNAKKDGMFTPLCTAIRDNHEALVDTLLKAGADPNEMASEYPAFKCVTHHRAHLLGKVLDAGADANNPKGIVEMAVARKNADALLILLERGVDPNARNPAGHTALTTALRECDLQAMDLLLSYGADPGVRGQEWPVTLAVHHPESLEKLLPHIAVNRIPKGALEIAVQVDKLESVKMLLAKGVDVEERNGGVFSSLTTSIREDRKEIFRFLLDEAGADPNLPGEHLPLIKAIRRHRENDLSYVKHLITRGADINLVYRGWNAVLQALDKGDTQVLVVLAEMGTPDLNARDEDGHTVLEILQERGMKEEEKILTAKGAVGSPTPKMREAFGHLRGIIEN